ncbi:MAG: RNA polymerase subunit alpha domain protein [Planctomycetaceae bacterium TMED10]|jgi:DNA-directed RNA polymerase subunit alpha|nr:MAG: RNA polymerase subunit alpha domain protein [Planctomycetaceae bacterium TMED10]
MSDLMECDLSQLVLSNNSFGPQEINKISSAIAGDSGQFKVLKNSVADLELQQPRSPATAVRLGVCYYLMGRYSHAAETLGQGDGGALTQFYLGKCHFADGNYAAAKTSFESAATAGYDPDTCALAIGETERYLGNAAGALERLNGLSGAVEQTAEYLYQRGACVAAIGGSPQEVVTYYERAVETDPEHPGALFGLAKETDRNGNDEDAVTLYERAATRFPSHVGTLLNLGVLYEDTGKFDRAIRCYQRILEIYPDHEQARLYMKDARASGDVMFDEDDHRDSDRVSQILSIPVSDFELSVRSRNCLQRMGIDSLGDLARTTEHELLASKNFGETSLVEIRDVLAAKGLELGALAHEKPQPDVPYEPESLSDDERAMHDRPIHDLSLSVRSRKCMVRLGINTIGELLRRTGDELLECKNFGVTSLREVREKLGPMGLRIRGD